MGTVNSNNMYNFELANQMGTFFYRKSSPLVLSSITWYRGYHPLLMTTAQYHLPRSANSTSFQRRRLANLAAAVQGKAAVWTLYRHP